MPYVKQPPPEGLDPSLRRRWSALQDLIGKNAAAEEKLATYGAGLRPDSVIHQRIQALIDVLFPFDGGTECQAKRLEIDEQMQRAANKFLERARSEVVKAMLAQGSMVPPALMAEMAKKEQQNIQLIRGTK